MLSVLYYIFLVAICTLFLVLSALALLLTFPFDRARRTVHELSRMLVRIFYAIPPLWSHRVIGLEHIDRSMHPLHLSPGDKVLLMSDGVFGTVPDEEIARLAGPADALTAAQNLENAVLAAQKPGQDNFTAIVVEYFGENGGVR